MGTITKEEWAGHSEGPASECRSGRTPGDCRGFELQRLNGVFPVSGKWY